MKSMIVLFVELAAVVAVAACTKNNAEKISSEAVMFVAPTNGCLVSREAWQKLSPAEKKAALQKAKTDAAVAALTGRDKRAAVSYGITLEEWATMSKKARKEVRQQAQAAKLGMTVEQMKAERNRKAAEKAGCPLEKWNSMNVKERIEFRKQAKAGQSAA